MKFTNFFTKAAIFFCVAFVVLTFILPTRTWVPGLNTYLGCILAPLILMVFCVILAYWPAFGGDKKKYVQFIVFTVGVAVIGTALVALIEAKIGLVAMFILSAAIVTVSSFAVLIMQIRERRLLRRIEISEKTK